MVFAEVVEEGAKFGCVLMVHGRNGILGFRIRVAHQHTFFFDVSVVGLCKGTEILGQNQIEVRATRSIWTLLTSLCGI